jgi:hypothetical protein
MQDEPPPSSELAQRLPTRELLLAQALDACISAERRVAGSAHVIIAQQPAWLRPDLQSMMSLAGTLDSETARATMSPEFRRAARARLMQHIGADTTAEPVAMIGPRLSALPSRNGHHPSARRRSRWLWRGSAGLLAAVLGVAATLTASASALPGDALYNLKQAQEELSVRLAPDDQSRALALLSRADARLDETARLLMQGRTLAALETTQRYGQNVERATTTYLITMDEPADSGLGPLSLELRLTQQQEQLQTILQIAPEPARADLREALVATERGRALVADPRPVERALGRASSDKSAVAAPVPTTAAEDSPTVAPTRLVPQPLAPVVAAATAPPAPETLVAQHEGTNRGGESSARPQNGLSTATGHGQQPAKAGLSQDRDDEDGPNSAPLVARDEGNVSERGNGDGAGRSGPTNVRNAAGSAPSQSELPVVTQRPNSANNANARGNGNDGDSGRGQGEDAPQPTVAAQGQGEDGPQPAVARDASGDNKQGGNATGAVAPRDANAKDTSARDGNGGNNNATVARLTPPQVASNGDKPNVGGRDDGETRAAVPAAPAGRPQPTPTPATTRRGSDGGDPNARPTPVPARTSLSDTRGGGNNDTGHPDD